MDFLKFYSPGKKEVLILYGCRRVGKTELIRHFIKDKPVIYFLADRDGLEANAKWFYFEAARQLNLPELDVTDFRKAFELITLFNSKRFACWSHGRAHGLYKPALRQENSPAKA